MILVFIFIIRYLLFVEPNLYWIWMFCTGVSIYTSFYLQQVCCLINLLMQLSQLILSDYTKRKVLP